MTGCKPWWEKKTVQVVSIFSISIGWYNFAVTISKPLGEKGENAAYQQFLIFPQEFQKSVLPHICENLSYVGKGQHLTTQSQILTLSQTTSFRPFQTKKSF